MTPRATNQALQLLLLGVIATLAAQVYLHFTPGAMSPDSISILSQARSGVFEDGHPPLLTGIWRALDRLAPGPIGILLLHLLMFYGGLFFIFRAAIGRQGLLVVGVCALVGSYPPLLGILGVIWIDITMAGLFLLAVGCWLSSGTSRFPRSGFLLAFVLVTLGISARHNAAAAAFPLLALFMLKQSAAGRATLMTVARAAAIAAIATLLLFIGGKWTSAQFVDQPRHLWRAAALYDIAGASHYENRDLFRSGVLLRPSLDEIHRLYSPRSYFPLVTGQQIHGRPDAAVTPGMPLQLDTGNSQLDTVLRQNWADVILEHPAAYLHHRFEFFTSMVRREPWGLWVPFFDAIYPNELGIQERAGTVPSLAFFHIHNLSQTSRMFEPLPYLLLSVLLFLPVLALGLALADRLLQTAGALYASGVCHMAGLFFFAVTPDFRYSHWLITATAIASGLLALALARYAMSALSRIWTHAHGRDPGLANR